MSSRVRLADRGDADAIGRLLYAFNREFDEPTPAPSVLAERMRQLLDGGVDEPDAAARRLYESPGFTNRSGGDGPLMYVYERDL